MSMKIFSVQKPQKVKKEFKIVANATQKSFYLHISIFWNPKVHYRVQKSPPLAPTLSQIDPVHTTQSYISKIHFNIVHRPTSWSS
jgi:hypothetical protein